MYIYNLFIYLVKKHKPGTGLWVPIYVWNKEEPELS
jgi:hypothetical protein